MTGCWALRCREGRWNEILGPRQKQVTLQSSLTVTALISSLNIFSVSPAQDWFLSPLLSHVLKRLRQAASVFKIPLANLFSKLETKIASHDCKEGMWLWNGMFHYSERGTGNFSPCLTLNSRDLKGPANRVSGYIVTLFESDLYFYICCIFQFIWYLFQLTQGRAGGWQLELDHLLTVGVKNENNNLSELLATSI